MELTSMWVWMWRRFGASYRWAVFVTTSIVVGALHVTAITVVIVLFYGAERWAGVAVVSVVGSTAMWFVVYCTSDEWDEIERRGAGDLSRPAERCGHRSAWSAARTDAVSSPTRSCPK